MDNYDEQAEETVVETEEVETPEVETTEETTEEEEAIDWKARALKAEQTIIKAKAKPQKEAKPEATLDASKVSTRDLIAITKANIDEDDIDEVVEYANYKKISIADALKSSVIKATLAENAELRKSAQAVNVGTTRRASGAISDERLMADAEKGIMPDSEADLGRLATLRLQRR